MTTPNKPKIPAALQARIDKLSSVEVNGLLIIEDFGIFIDTHRDQPHIGTFLPDIHRGMCAPTPVNYVIQDDFLVSNGNLLMRHEKHMFIEHEAWQKILMEILMTTGEDPRAGDGTMPTSHFRDARAGLYLLKSFRQMVTYNERKK